MKKIIPTIFILFLTIFAASVFAEEQPKTGDIPLFISAFNAGYKDESSTQNYDFIELTKTSDDVLPLAGFRLIYNNSSDNKAGEVVFSGTQILEGKRLVLGFSKSPQYQDWEDSSYVYYFSSSGMASTAGRLSLFRDDELIDELCWGKINCNNENPKFSTGEEDNYSLVRSLENMEFSTGKYYPNIENVIIQETPENEKALCEVRISEIYSYYANDTSEQFIELYNPTDMNQDISSCVLLYKNKEYTINDILYPKSYYVYRNPDLILTKDPSTFNTITLGDFDYLLPHGQKKGTSYAAFNIGTEEEKWLNTYTPTPGEENIFQEFRSCEEGKIINPETGNCIKESVDEEIICPDGKYLNPLTGRCKTIEVAKTIECKNGYYLNPETGRCKKQSDTTAIKECAEGYERNPETNRCRKIKKNDGADYPVSDISEEEYDNPKIFIATGVIIILGIAGVSYAIYQYRKEIKKGILKICHRNVS